MIMVRALWRDTFKKGVPKALTRDLRDGAKEKP